jgi:hypothetical protein
MDPDEWWGGNKVIPIGRVVECVEGAKEKG